MSRDNRPGRSGSAPVVQGPPEPEPPRKAHHVVGPGSVRVRGEVVGEGESVSLSDAEAHSLGSAVREGAAPPPPASISARVAGRYKVATGNNVRIDGKTRKAGSVLELTERDARSLGAAVEPVRAQA